MRLFNINGIIGQGAYDTGEFPDVSDFVNHLDYLGIEKSLVSHIMSRDLNANWGNKKILEIIKENNLDSRLFPAFTLTPATFYENGSKEFIKDCLDNKKVKAFRIFPEECRFEPLLLKQIINYIRDDKPVIIWDISKASLQNFNEFSLLAEIFPEVSFAAIGFPPFGFGQMIEFLRKHKNTYFDISKIHFLGYIELIVKEFGAERLLFGINEKFNYGASIGALAHYNISNTQKEMIAYKTIANILEIDHSENISINDPSIMKEKPLWNNFSQGKPLTEERVIDGHGHIGPLAWYYFNDISLDHQRDYLLQDMEKLGIDKMLLSVSSALFSDPVEGNKSVEKVLEKYPDKFSGYLVYNPLYGEKLAPLFDDFFSRDYYVGFKLLATYWKVPVTDEKYNPVWKYADKHKLPILLHTWDDKFNSPGMLSDIVRKYPNAIFILGHSGGGMQGRLEAEELANKNNNVYLEFCGSFKCAKSYEKTIENVGTNRIIFGTDSYGHNAAWEMGRFLSLPVADSELIPALSKNIENICSLSGRNL